MHYILSAGTDQGEPDYLATEDTLDDIMADADSEFDLYSEQYSALYNTYYTRLNELEQGANWVRIIPCDCYAPHCGRYRHPALEARE